MYAVIRKHIHCISQDNVLRGDNMAKKTYIKVTKEQFKATIAKAREDERASILEEAAKEQEANTEITEQSTPEEILKVLHGEDDNE